MTEPDPNAPAPSGRSYAHGALYISIASWATQAIALVIGLVVARLLGPEAFGSYAFAVAITEMINIISPFAISNALIQSREESENQWDTGYAMTIGQGIPPLLVALAVSPYLSTHRSAEVAGFVVLLVLSRTFVLLGDVVLARLDRSLRFGAVSMIQLLTRNVPNLAGLGLVWLGVGPVSLVIRDLLIGATTLLLAHWWARYLFRGRVDRGSFKKLASFAGPMAVPGMLEVLLQRLDRFSIGLLFGNVAIGLYHQARFVAEAGRVAVAPMTRVTFNLYARLQDDLPRLRRALGIVTYFMVRVFFGGAMALVVYPEEILLILLGEEWIEAAPMLQVLGVYAALVPLLDNVKTLLYARGQILANVWLRLIQLAVIVPGVGVAAWTGRIEIVAAGVVIASLLGLIVGASHALDVSSGSTRWIYGTPLLAVVATCGAFYAIEQRALLPAPFWLRPFLPPLFCWALIAAIERGRLWSELAYLRRQLIGQS